MRDYRDAKAMAQTLRDGLKAKSVDITHSAALELIAKALGFRDWHVLAARIEGDRPAAGPTKRPPESASTPSTMYCSFCGKPQHEVAKLIAGPGGVFICDECTGLCEDIVADQAPETYVEAQHALAAKSTEELVVLKAKARSSIVRARQLLNTLRALEAEAGSSSLGAPIARGHPQRQVFLRQSPAERAAYVAEAEARIAGIQRVSEAAAALLAERGVTLDP